MSHTRWSQIKWIWCDIVLPCEWTSRQKQRIHHLQFSANNVSDCIMDRESCMKMYRDCHNLLAYTWMKQLAQKHHSLHAPAHLVPDVPSWHTWKSKDSAGNLFWYINVSLLLYMQPQTKTPSTWWVISLYSLYFLRNGILQLDLYNGWWIYRSTIYYTNISVWDTRWWLSIITNLVRW